MIIFSLDKPLKKINLSNSPVHLPTASLCSVLFIKDPRFGLITVEGQKDWRSGQVHCETVWALISHVCETEGMHENKVF